MIGRLIRRFRGRRLLVVGLCAAGLMVLVGAFEDEAGSQRSEPATPAGNLLANPGFAGNGDGVPDGWSLDPALRAKGSVDVVDAASATRLLRLRPNNRNTEKEKPFAVAQLVPVQAYRGRRLQVAAAMRTEGGAVGFVLVFALDRSGKPVGQVVFEQLDARNELSRQVDELTIDKRAERVLFALATNTTQGTVWFGDVHLGAMEAAANESERDPAHARIRVDATRILRDVPETLFGTNIEWVRNGNEIWDAARDELREQFVERARTLGVSVIRYPGGVFADYYHWRDGIGPRHDRPRRPHVADAERSAVLFGTHEFIEFCRLAGATPLIQANVVTGSAEEAAAWVSYCNDRDHEERARNGSPRPLEVRFWEIGNEQYTRPDFLPVVAESSMSADEYIRRFREFVPRMRQADPSIKILVPGGTNFGRYALVADPNWNERVLRALAPDIDYLAVHNAYAPIVNEERASAFVDVYRAMLAFPLLIEQNLRSIDEQIRQLAGPHADRIRIAITEWGPLFAMTPASPYLDHVKTLGSGLFVASALQAFLRSPRVDMATAFKFTERGFMGWVNGDGEPKPAYYAMQMIRQRLGDHVIETRTEAPTFDVRAIGGVTSTQRVPVLDVIAGLSRDGAEVSLIVVNKEFEFPITADIEVAGFQPDSRSLVTVLTAPSLDANNGPDLPKDAYGGWARQASAPTNSMFDSGKPGTVAPRERVWEGSGQRFSFTFEPRSVTALQMRARR